MGTMSLWLCDDPGLPPFHLLVHEVPRPHDRTEWDEQVARLLRKKKMFPFLAELKGEGGGTLAKWSVLSLRTDVTDKELDSLFEVPEGQHRLPSR